MPGSDKHLDYEHRREITFLDEVIQFRVLKNQFIFSKHISKPTKSKEISSLPRDFDYVMYLTDCLCETLSDVLDVTPATWAVGYCVQFSF